MANSYHSLPVVEFVTPIAEDGGGHIRHPGAVASTKLAHCMHARSVRLKNLFNISRPAPCVLFE